MAFYKYKYKNKTSSKKTSSKYDNMKRKILSKSYKQETPKLSFESRVQHVINKNVENKYTNTLVDNKPVGNVTNSGVPNLYFYDFYTWTPGGQAATGEQLFNLIQGSKQNERSGNTIKLKRWVIKGMISPNIVGVSAPYAFNGYVDVYFGRLKYNTTPINNQLLQLYQNGSSAITPSMIYSDFLCPINKDVYKIYYHKRFKTGNAGLPFGFSTGPITSMEVPLNNDYSLTHTFGFDVCKYVCKDRIIKYADGTTLPMDNDITNLTLFATFTPFAGQAFNQTDTPLPTYMTMNVVTYAEYEDA